MKNLMVRTRPFTMLTSRLVVMVLFAALLSGAPFHAALAPTAPDLGTAARFAVLGGPAVTLTDATVKGDVGVNTGTAVTLTRSTILGTIHAGDAVAQQAYSDFLDAYAALAAEPCGTYLTGTLDGVTLPPGVYCFDAAAVLTGQLTLDGPSDGIWIFKIGTSGTGALTATNFSVVMSSGETCNNNVYWWTAEAATLTDSVFIGSILSGAAITVTRGSLDGQALAKAAVTLTGANVAVCGTFEPPFPPFPPVPAIKVTGGGQIPVPYPYSKGRATFGFNAQPDKKDGAKGNLNYVNHVTGLHVNGAVTSIYVIAVNPDGSPKTVLFSGTWEGGSFFVTVEDHGERGSDDQFGITVTTATDELIEVIEVMSQRVISNGNIQFHK
ncbi:MAG: ice-binding family protein [Candidatus Aminicenantes bacterium]|nr:ice-binding family protein [Candidatus Aminicenantes bacterium]